MPKDDIHSFFGQFINENENRSQVLNLIAQQAIKNAQVFQERRIAIASCKSSACWSSVIKANLSDHYLRATLVSYSVNFNLH